MRILIVEDDPAIGRTVSRGFREEGHVVDLVLRGRDALTQARDVPYDAVVLDWTLPDVDGLAVLRGWRDAGLRVPVIVLTARGTVGERVAGLRAGADDYLVKPFAFDELLARLEALQRRAAGQLERPEVDGYAVDGRRRCLVGPGGVEVPLTPREFALASELFRHASDVRSRAQLLLSVWGSEFIGNPNVVDVYVGYLRQKLARIGPDAPQIRAVRGIGFRLVRSTVGVGSGSK
jgi:DNA-binding response OmpR family regulator